MAEVIAFETVENGRARIHLFDRRSRQILRLDQLNRAAPVADPVIDWFGSCLLVTARVGDNTDIWLYDLRTGLIDPLPELNRPGINLLPPDVPLIPGPVVP